MNKFNSDKTLQPLGSHSLDSTPAFSDEEVAAFRNDTPGTANVNHLNNAGAGLMPNVVTQAVLEHITLESQIGGYEASALRADAVQQFYIQAGKLLNCKPTNIAFTASATDSYTRALSSIPFEVGDIILTDTDDFISNQIQFLSCKKRFNVEIVRIKDAPEGGVDLADLEYQLIKLKPRLLAITHIPTNSGLIQPVKQIAAIYELYISTNPGQTWYILDACQSAGQMKLDVEELKCDFLSLTGRKFLRGPRGTGFLYISDKALQAGLEPLFIDMRGADWVAKDEYLPQPDAKRYEDWEFAYALILGMSEAIIYYLNIGEDKIWQQVKYLSDYTRRELAAINGVRVLDRGLEQGALVTFHIKGFKPATILDALKEKHINVVPSYKRFAVIDFDNKQVEWAIRASPHYYNTLSEIDQFIEAIKEIVAN
ncbi:aminotransferase class V-fold PLP-dependent enzyme [Mucilaginibacter jinjuensis]|uniref:Aminotransferase class V-fold PLP-dependent enzyme n=1 Tax=Mucilaginibacter jinjuensis TaxID=1176721 RepID=A0ABY7T5Y4_9SPHI|nr:aminotransferase class V-fold PLP-dependent enzyme [Mucilaginibacter jinjuensis]WCT11659.1 aminotransferase class V-fold PLP-dependent enzyme [Mucilaginibacter jinjuensis]